MSLPSGVLYLLEYPWLFLCVLETLCGETGGRFFAVGPPGLRKAPVAPGGRVWVDVRKEKSFPPTDFARGSSPMPKIACPALLAACYAPAESLIFAL